MKESELQLAASHTGRDRRLTRRKGVKATIYLLPNMITATSLFFGFLSLKLSTDGQFLFAAYAVLAAGVCDGLDGSVARLTRTQSAFGVQFDSLCDLVAFGVAPAWLAFQFGAKDFGRLGFASCFIFLACGALRLARFNVASSVGKAGGNFIGIPIPIAAACVAVFVMMQDELRMRSAELFFTDWAATVAEFASQPNVARMTLVTLLFVAAAGMISSFEYLSTKKIRLPRRRPFRVLAGILVLTVLLASIDLTITLFLLLSAYVLHGPVLWLFYKRDRSADEEAIFASDDDAEQDDDGEEGEAERERN